MFGVAACSRAAAGRASEPDGGARFAIEVLNVRPRKVD
jgi:hypothetical protein